LHLRAEIRALQRRLGVTTILVTHDQEEALTMADRIVVMNHGTVEQVGAPEEVYAAPRTRFVAEFVGTMNFLRVRVAAEGRCEIGGVVIACATKGLAPGASMDIAIRPEDIQLLPAHGGLDCLPGTISALEFLGSGYRASVRLDALSTGRESARTSVLLCDVTRREMSVARLGPGARCAIRFLPENATIFPCV
jgi:iron(III) transport system ATP-binding protein